MRTLCGAHARIAICNMLAWLVRRFSFLGQTHELVRKPSEQPAFCISVRNTVILFSLLATILCHCASLCWRP